MIQKHYADIKRSEQGLELEGEDTYFVQKPDFNEGIDPFLILLEQTIKPD